MYLIDGSVYRRARSAWGMEMLLYLAILGCKETEGFQWEVTVTGGDVDDDGSATNCTTDTTGYQETLVYSIIYEGTYSEISVGEDFFALGEHRGCALTYTSSLFLEEAPAGDFRWEISGVADVQGAGGGCTSIPEGYDWQGTETLTVVSSENDDIEEGCTYEMSVQGVYISE